MVAGTMLWPGSQMDMRVDVSIPQAGDRSGEIKRTIPPKSVRPSLQKPTHAIKYQVVRGIRVWG
jgi:hypothetical protein